MGNTFLSTIRRSFIVLFFALVLYPGEVGAVTVATPQGPTEVFARGDLVDVVALLRLSGAEVQFASAAGSYTAIANDHEVQFTPGGSLAVVDGKLTRLPGPTRSLEGKIVASFATANTLLAPFGWLLRGSNDAPELTKSGIVEHLRVELIKSETGSLVVIRGTSQRPRTVVQPGAVTLIYPAAVELAAPIPVEGVLVSGELRETTLVLRLASGFEVASSYPLDDPPRYVIRIGALQPTAPAAASRQGPLVVLDPGHGGEDLGARGPGGEQEKDISLAVARATAVRLQAAGISARLTRESDDPVSLTERTALANRLQAGVFVSVHVNSSPAKGARGTETYFMNADASDPMAAQSAARENLDGSPDAVQLILWDLAHVANLNQSAHLARLIQERLNTAGGTKDRGVRQAPFVVLTGATMPAALVEVGFLSNPEEARRLLTSEVQNQVATALAAAIQEFLRTPQSLPPAPANPGQ